MAKQIINFNRNILERRNVQQFGAEYSFTDEVKESLDSLHDQLLEIQANIGDKDNVVLELEHSINLPPKTKRFTSSMKTLSEDFIYAKSQFINFNSDDVKLLIYYDATSAAVDSAINKIVRIKTLIEFIEREITNGSITILRERSDSFSDSIRDAISDTGMTKTAMIKLLHELQKYFGTLRRKQSDFALTGRLIVSFAKASSADQFINENNVNNDSVEKINDVTYTMDANDISDDEMIINAYSDEVISSDVDYSGVPYGGSADIASIDFSEINNDYKIGILDGGINESSVIFPHMEYTKLTPGHSTIFHGEAVSSAAMLGPLFSSTDDGLPVQKVHLFEVLDSSTTTSKLVERIESCISNNRDIKVWNLSINSTNIIAADNGEVSWLGAQLDRIQGEYSVIICQSAGNHDNAYPDDFAMKAPSDSVRSLVVTSASSIDDIAEYSMNGFGKFSTRKPDVAAFGGTTTTPFVVVEDGILTETMGTSFASPYIARKLAHLIHVKGYTIIEAKALIIHAANYETFSSNESYDIEKLGWGVVPDNIRGITETSDGAIRFVFRESISDTKKYYPRIKIPVNEVSGNRFMKYSLFSTQVSDVRVNEYYGAEYVRSVVSSSFGVIKNEDGQFGRKLSSSMYSSGNNTREAQLIKVFGKWKSTFCTHDIVKRRRNADNILSHGISTKIDKRMEVINSRTNLDISIVITAKHIEEMDMYNEFTLENSNIINSLGNTVAITLDGDIDIS